MPDVLLINPGDDGYQNLDTALEPPLWCRLIAGYCRDRGLSVGIIDAAVSGFEIHPASDLVCIVVHGHQPSASTQSMPRAGEIARAIKAENPGRKIIMVGGHVAALPERTLREEAIDYACNGEGPETVVGLAQGKPLERIPGLVWHGPEGIVENPPAELLPMSALHGDAWGLLDMTRYRAHNWQCLDGSPRTPYASIHTSLSCPFSCSFCMIDAPFVKSKPRQYRTRAPGDVVREIALLHDRYGVTTFKIADEMFVLNPKHYVPICDGLAALPYAGELNIWAYARVDTVKDGHLGLLRKAGVRWLALGIESGSAHVRDGADKHFGNDEIESVVRAIQNEGINVIGNFIFGLPDDTRETMSDTLDLALKLRCEFANFYTAMAYPGSRLYDQADPKALPKAWSGYSQHSVDCTPLPTWTLSGAEVLRFRDQAFKTYFTDPGYLDLIERRFGAADRIRAMAAQPLKRMAA